MERALGTLRSGSLGPTIGARFVNGASGPIISLDVSYAGEEWRLRTAERDLCRYARTRRPVSPRRGA